MLILGIESSCDETAAAILRNGTELLANVVASQVEVHSIYGGVVPELASRKHVEAILPVVEEALGRAGKDLDDIDGLAVTNGPGLVGSLLVGLSFAKAVAMVKKIPYVGVDHITGHLLSVFLGNDTPRFPYIALTVSGGHSSIFQVLGPQTFRQLGRTRDDAAGEAFDKVAKLLDLGYPGGPIIAQEAEKGRADAIAFPRSWLEPDSLDFSFSGIKTAVVNHVAACKKKGDEIIRPDICASFQEAVVEVLAEKTIRAAQRTGIKDVVLSGGVAANDRLRTYLTDRGKEEGLSVSLPPLPFCTDNAAMIALAGYHRFQADATGDFHMDAYSRSRFPVYNIDPAAGIAR